MNHSGRYQPERIYGQRPRSNYSAVEAPRTSPANEYPKVSELQRFAAALAPNHLHRAEPVIKTKNKKSPPPYSATHVAKAENKKSPPPIKLPPFPRPRTQKSPIKQPPFSETENKKARRPSGNILYRDQEQKKPPIQLSPSTRPRTKAQKRPASWRRAFCY